MRRRVGSGSTSSAVAVIVNGPADILQAVQIRPARPDDDRGLRALDLSTWTWMSSPAPHPADDEPFFDERCRPEDVLVAEDMTGILGYVRLGRPTPLASNAHVLMVKGLAVAPAARRRGLGRRLMDAAVREATARGARRLTLRVFAPNEAARRLYEACGFEVEGVLRGEFRLDGRDVDDVQMARRLTPADV